MNRKIGQYLPFGLALIAVVMLLATAGKAPPLIETTVPTTTATESGIPAETTQLPAEMSDSVRKILDRVPLSETACCYSVYDPDLHASGNVPGLGSEAYAFELAEYCADTPINPVAGFLELVNRELYHRVETEDQMLEIPLYDAFENPAELKNQELHVEPETYEFSKNGTRALVSDLIRVSEKTGSKMNYEDQLLGFGRKLKAEVHYSEQDECYYTYFVYYGDATASFVCLYLRSADGTEITDVELQVLDCEYFGYDVGAGFSMSQENTRCEKLWQQVSWITALEKLITGQTRVGLEADETTLRLPLAYELEESDVMLKRSVFLCDRETGEEYAELITYRIRK